MKQPTNYIYPAILTFEEGYEIAVTFPDLPGCATSGETEAEALLCAKEALGLHLFGMEQDGDIIPEPTSVKSLMEELDSNECISVIDVFMPSIRAAQENKSINRTVTLPAWLNAKALENNINFSQVLQTALIEKLNLK
ncbi:MAG: type II toxin-antitoxin system HicB family antitoxin [Clostridia bacterium]|nr:type II toxin-antitoxin system HicB family antitoxin [Clostridia bacterium]